MQRQQRRRCGRQLSLTICSGSWLGGGEWFRTSFTPFPCMFVAICRRRVTHLVGANTGWRHQRRCLGDNFSQEMGPGPKLLADDLFHWVALCPFSPSLLVQYVSAQPSGPLWRSLVYASGTERIVPEDLGQLDLDSTHGSSLSKLTSALKSSKKSYGRPRYDTQRNSKSGGFPWVNPHTYGTMLQYIWAASSKG